MRAQTASNASANPALELVRRSATRCVLAVAALAFICNLGTLAVPLFNMQVFGRVLPTRDLGTMGALAVSVVWRPPTDRVPAMGDCLCWSEN